MKRVLMVMLAGSLPLLGMLASCKRAAKPEPAAQEERALQEEQARQEELAQLEEIRMLVEQQIAEQQLAAEKEAEFLASLTAEDLFSDEFWQQATPKAVHYLVSEGADVHARDENGWTAFMVAARASRDPALNIALLEHAPELFAEADDGTSIFTIMENNEALKDSELHRNLQTWHMNNMHIEYVAEQQAAQEPAVETSPVE